MKKGKWKEAAGSSSSGVQRAEFEEFEDGGGEEDRA